MRRKLKRAAPDTFELSEEVKDSMAAGWHFFGGVNPANLEVYDPRDQQRIPETGSWIMITRALPPLENRIDQHIRVGRIFYAERRTDGELDAAGFARDGTYKILLHSPWGDVCLWPYEYSRVSVDALLAMWTAEELAFHPGQIDIARFNEIAFYARSRGIGLGDAAVMALGTMEGSGVGWFEPREDLAVVCEGMAERVHAPLSVRPTINRGQQA